MAAFGTYSRYYDLLYADKDYKGEADFVRMCLERSGLPGKQLLELGCGTGKHAELLAQAGYHIHGVDLSTEMLTQAERRRSELGEEIAGRLEYHPGDARDYSSGRSFDAVLSLFHVVSYQTTNADLLAMFRNVAHQLRDGGIFLFDYWYGPAVLTQRPETRVKRLEDDTISVMRIAESKLDTSAAVVDVNYEIHVRDKRSGSIETLTELHRMHYLFETEIELLAQLAGLHVVDCFEFGTGNTPHAGTWSVCSVLRK